MVQMRNMTESSMRNWMHARLSWSFRVPEVALSARASGDEPMVSSWASRVLSQGKQHTDAEEKARVSHQVFLKLYVGGLWPEHPRRGHGVEQPPAPSGHPVRPCSPVQKQLSAASSLESQGLMVRELRSGSRRSIISPAKETMSPPASGAALYRPGFVCPSEN